MHKRRASEAEGVLALALGRGSLLVDHAADQVVLELLLLTCDYLLLLAVKGQRLELLCNLLESEKRIHHNDDLLLFLTLLSVLPLRFLLRNVFRVILEASLTVEPGFLFAEHCLSCNRIRCSRLED